MLKADLCYFDDTLSPNCRKSFENKWASEASVLTCDILHLCGLVVLTPKLCYLFLVLDPPTVRFFGSPLLDLRKLQTALCYQMYCTYATDLLLLLLFLLVAAEQFLWFVSLRKVVCLGRHRTLSQKTFLRSSLQRSTLLAVIIVDINGGHLKTLLHHLTIENSSMHFGTTVRKKNLQEKKKKNTFCSDCKLFSNFFLLLSLLSNFVCH